MFYRLCGLILRCLKRTYFRNLFYAGSFVYWTCLPQIEAHSRQTLKCFVIWVFESNERSEYYYIGLSDFFCFVFPGKNLHAQF